MVFAPLLVANENDLERIRNKYFPLVRTGLITGYDIHQSRFDYSQGNLFLNYLHYNLGKEDKHLKELVRKIRTEWLII